MTTAAHKTDMANQEHLLRWLRDSGRPFLVLNAEDLVNGMCTAYGWPEGGRIVQDMVFRYSEERSARKSESGDGTTTAMGDGLNAIELDRAIRQLVGQITDLDPSWSLSNAPT